MKWLIVLASLFAYGQASAEGLCKPLDRTTGKFSCIAGWNGATNHLAYSGALAAMLDKFTQIIVYDSYVNNSYWFGYRCDMDPGFPDYDPPEPSEGCNNDVLDKSVINVPVANAFHRTLKAAIGTKSLMDALKDITRSVSYDISIDGGLKDADGRIKDPGERIKDPVPIADKMAACSALFIHTVRIAPRWSNFANSFQQDYDAYDDQYRKKIYKNYFQAIKRLYGFYTNRMKKIIRQIKREYDCNF